MLYLANHILNRVLLFPPFIFFLGISRGYYLSVTDFSYVDTIVLIRYVNTNYWVIFSLYVNEKPLKNIDIGWSERDWWEDSRN